KVTVGDAVKAISFAIQVHKKFGAGANIRVLNASFGYLGVPSDPQLDPTHLPEAIELAGSNDINEGSPDMLFVASAGEDGNDNDWRPHYPSSFSDLSNLLSVTAIDQTGGLANYDGTYANHGSASVDLGAPGVDIYSTYPFDP